MADKTFGKIGVVIDPPINASTVMFLVNAAYFKAAWTTAFDIADTKDETFRFVDGGEPVVPMMTREVGF